MKTMSPGAGTPPVAVNPLPPWAQKIREKYLRGEATQFILHGNVYDDILFDGEYFHLAEFLFEKLLKPTKKTVLRYGPSEGMRALAKSPLIGDLNPLLTAGSFPKALPLLEKILLEHNNIGVIFEYAELLLPAAELHFMSDDDRRSLAALHRWSIDPVMRRSDNIVILIAESLAEVHPKLLSNARNAIVEVPLPDVTGREVVIRKCEGEAESTLVARLVAHTAGLKVAQIVSILAPEPVPADDDAARAAFIRKLLDPGPNLEERVAKFLQITRGFSMDEIQALINPSGPHQEADAEAAVADPYADVWGILTARKRELIEKECFGLIEFIDSPFDFSVVGGMEEIKKELIQIAEVMKSGDKNRAPMGLLFVGPMGTGKTFVASAFAKECGIIAIKLKNFRSKWVGSTESNLEKILTVIKALGPIIVIIDEGDRSIGGESGDSDGGTSSRVVARLKEFMSDTANRGNVLFILMTNRPDKLDVDMKRPGRLDRKIPFFYNEDTASVEAVLSSQFRKQRLQVDIVFDDCRPRTSERLKGYANSDIEAIVVLAGNLAADTGSVVTAAHLEQAIDDFLPSRDETMLEFMELQAVFEASSRKLLPAKYREITNEELSQRLRTLKMQFR